MGFKKISQNIPKNEGEFINSARGETNGEKRIVNRSKKAYRSKKIVISFTEAEYERLTQEANIAGLSINSYVRFRVFKKD